MTERARLVVVMGVSGAGKTTVGTALAARLGVPYADGDGFHAPDSVAKMARGEPLDDVDRVPWLDAIADWLRAHADRGAVVSCSALRRAYRARLSAAAPATTYLHLTGSDALCPACEHAARPLHAVHGRLALVPRVARAK